MNHCGVMPFGYSLEKFWAFGAVKSEVRVAPILLSGLMVVSSWPSSEGRERKAVAKITGTTPAAINLIGRIDLMPP